MENTRCLSLSNTSHSYISEMNLWNSDISLHYFDVCFIYTHHTYLSTVIDIVSSTGQNRLLYSVSGVKFSVNNPPTIRHRSPETWSFITLWWLEDSVSISMEISLIGDRGSASADEWLAEQMATGLWGILCCVSRGPENIGKILMMHW